MIKKAFFVAIVTVAGLYNVSDASAQLFRRDQPNRGQQDSQSSRQAPPRDGRFLATVLGAAVEGYAEYEHQKSMRQQSERDHEHRVQMDQRMLEQQNRQQAFENDQIRRRQRQDEDWRRAQQNAAMEDRQRQIAASERQRKANERAQSGAAFGGIAGGAAGGYFGGPSGAAAGSQMGQQIGGAVGNDVIREGINGRKEIDKAIKKIRF